MSEQKLFFPASDLMKHNQSLDVPIGDGGIFLTLKRNGEHIEIDLGAQSFAAEVEVTIVRGIFSQMCQIYGDNGQENLSQITFREIENMLRDQNSERSFDQSHQAKMEQLFVDMKAFFNRIYRIHDFFSGFDRNSISENSSFFLQLKSFDLLRLEMKSFFDLEEYQLPRLNTWDPKSGELSFLVGAKTELSQMEGALFRLCWLELAPIKRIKMVASEAS